MRTALNQKLSFWVIILIIVITIGLCRYHTLLNKPHQPSSLPSVVLAQAKTQDVPVYLAALGGVTATDSVTVRTQINGQLLNVFFKEGQLVKAGDMLAQIDARPYQALLTQYEGQLQRDKALLANALIDLKRYQTLWKQDSVSQQTLATQQSLVDQYIGAVKNDEGLIQSVQVNLIYCRILSPINGRIGLRLVDPGNFVQTTDTNGIAVINTLNPIDVVFTLPEDNIPQVMPLINRQQAVQVQAYNRQQNRLLATGTLLTVDNQVDPTTGTVKLKARFDNTDNLLFANQFVNIKLLVKTLAQATIIPTAAIQHSSKSDFVYLFHPNQTVSEVNIVSGPSIGDDTSITWGILPDQLVVVEGADKLSNGAKVTAVGPNGAVILPPKSRLASLVILRRFLL